MPQDIKSLLQQEKPGKVHDRLLSDCKSLMALSRNKMKDYHNIWCRNDEVYRAIKSQVDKEDLAARDRKEPEKMVVPISFSQIQTFVAFCYSLFTQRDRFFELEGYTAEDDRAAKVGEALLARDLSKNVFEAMLHQFLLDIARFGLGILKCQWSVEKQMVTETTPQSTTSMGVTLNLPSTETEVEKVVFEGNRVMNVSPFKWFPDTRLPLSRFQEGEFCASEERYSMTQLKKWEKQGVCYGVQYVQSLSREAITERNEKWDEGTDSPALYAGTSPRGDGQLKDMVIVTEMQREIVPSEYEIDDGVPIGPEDYPVKYVFWIANDNRIIKCEPLGYLHNEFTYSVSQFIPDNHKHISDGLADVIDPLQSVITWMINAKITNVRKIISDKLVVKTENVNMQDIKDRAPIIRLKATATGSVDDNIKQLQLQDVTSGHIQDAKFLHELVQIATGINDTILGQVRAGKRSATENRNTTSGAATRLKTIATIIFRTGLEPLGRQMLSNLRDGLTTETYVKALGDKAVATPEFVLIRREDLIGNYDFEIFDGTLPTERHLIAQALEELLASLISNPQLGQVLGFDVRKIFMETLALRGVRNPERFLLPPQPMIQQQPQLDQNGQPITSTTGTPDASGTSPAANDPTLTGQSGGTATGFPSPVGQSILPFPSGGFGS